MNLKYVMFRVFHVYRQRSLVSFIEKYVSFLPFIESTSLEKEGTMSVESEALNTSHCCLKRKLSQSKAIKSCKTKMTSDPGYFWDGNQKCIEELMKNETDCVKSCPNGKFFATYMKQTRSMHDMLGIMDDFLNCDAYSFCPSTKIRRKFRCFTKNFQTQLNQMSLELMEEMRNDREHASGSSVEEPATKLKRLTSVENDAKSNTEEEPSKLSDSEFDLNGSDIDLHLEEAMDEITEIERKVTSNAFSNKDQTGLLNGGGTKDSSYYRGLNFDADGFLTVYVDGSCLNNGKSQAQAGIGVWFGENHPLNLSDRVKGTPTNNNAEIQAATRAVKQAKSIGIEKLRVYTDSQFLINCMTHWIRTWKRNNWINSSNKPVINKESLKELDEVISTIKAVDWKYVPAHKGTTGNERADFLAKEGAKK